MAWRFYYHLDPHDHEVDLWAFRLDLRPPRVSAPRLDPPDPAPLPAPEIALGIEELRQAWTGAGLHSWSGQRLALAILDAHGEPMHPDDIVAFVAQFTQWHVLRADRPQVDRRGCPIVVLGDGRWAVAVDALEAVRAARQAVRARLETARRRTAAQPDPVLLEASRKAFQRQRAAHVVELAQMQRALLTAFPPESPRAVTLLDVGKRAIETFVDGELASLRERLTSFDSIGAVDVRPLLRALAFDPGQRRLGELGPPQKSIQLDRRGRTLRITTALLVKGSCRITRPFSDPAKLADHLARGQFAHLRDRIEADVKSLAALYQYGRTHGSVRVRWGFLDELIPVPWVHSDEPTLHRLELAAFEQGVPLEIVAGHVPDWSDPWWRVQLAHVVKQNLKRGSSLASVIGSVIGSIPPAIGWVRAGGLLDGPILSLSFFLLMWQVPHFWLLAMRLDGDYERASFPTFTRAVGENPGVIE